MIQAGRNAFFVFVGSYRRVQVSSFVDGEDFSLGTWAAGVAPR